MKKILSSIIAITFLFSCFIANTYAYEEHIIYQCIEQSFDDGSYIETIIEQSSPLTRAKSLSGSKTKNYKDKNGNIIWYLKVNGKFSYNGKSDTDESIIEEYELEMSPTFVFYKKGKEIKRLEGNVSLENLKEFFVETSEN